MSEALAKLGTQTTQLSAEVLANITKVGDYIPPIRLMNAMSDAINDASINIKAGEFLWDMNVNLGKSVDLIPICYRPHAMFIEARVVQRETFKIDEVYKEIQAQADAKPKVQGAMAGLDYLCYVKGKGLGIYFFYGTAKKAAPMMNANIHKVVTLQSKFVETPKFKWWTPEVVACTNPFDVTPEDEAQLQKIVDKFINPTTTSVGQTEGGRER